MPAPAGHKGFTFDATGKFKLNFACDPDCRNGTVALQVWNRQGVKKVTMDAKAALAKDQAITQLEGLLSWQRGRHESRRRLSGLGRIQEAQLQFEQPWGHVATLPSACRTGKGRCQPLGHQESGWPRKLQGA